MCPVEKKTILLYGFDDRDLSALVDHIRSSPSVGQDSIFAAITETSKTWTVGSLLAELGKEDEFLRKKKDKQE